MYYLVRKVAAVTGRDLRNARPSLDENNQPAVGFSLTSEGGRKFGKVTVMPVAAPGCSTSIPSSSMRGLCSDRRDRGREC